MAIDQPDYAIQGTQPRVSRFSVFERFEPYLASGQGEDEGYADGIFEEGVLFADAVFVEHLAVVAGIDDQGIFPQSLFFEPVDDAADAVVEVGDKAVVGGDGY